MGETSNSKYQPHSLEKLKNNYKTILLFSEKGQSSRAECLVNSLKDETSRQKEIEKKKKEMKETLFQTSISKISTQKNVPIFFGKRILHKMIDDGEPVWYEGIVTEVLDDDEQDEECEFTVKYDGYEDTFQVQLVKEWREKCVIIKCKASLDEPEKKKRKMSAVP